MLNSSHSLMHRLEEASPALKRAAVSSLALQETRRPRLAGGMWADLQQHWTVFAPHPESAGLRHTTAPRHGVRGCERWATSSYSNGHRRASTDWRWRVAAAGVHGMRLVRVLESWSQGARPEADWAGDGLGLVLTTS